MDVHLDNEAEAVIAEIPGDYRSVEELVKVAVCLLRNLHRRGDLDARLAIGVAQADGGATYDMDEVFDALEARYSGALAAE